ncbi:hypothetical protein ACFLTM_05655, partial [Candidatus Bipolaricaulota bacterium]
RLLDECIGAGVQDDILIVYDGFGAPLGVAISEECDRRKIYNCALFVSLDRQSREQEDTRLWSCLSDRSVLVTALSAADQGTGFRIELIREALRAGARVVHMPGLEEQEFVDNVMETDFAEVHRISVLLQEVVARSNHVTARTSRPTCPTSRTRICGGIATPGEIINFPTGEVYFAPIEGTATGSVVLNGSAQNCVLGAREEVILRFDGGVLQLSECEFVGGEDVAFLRRDLETIAGNLPCSMTLCEFGIGTNSGITELCGENVVDEKQLGTAHIALGGNSIFGGVTKCHYHHDLVFFPTAVECDNRVLEWMWRKRE